MSPRTFLRTVLLASIASIASGAEPPSSEPARIVVIGDSTVCEYPETSPARGWGHYFPEYFNDRAKIINLAASGRSTKTFIAEGRWAKALAEHPAYILIQFGHNDSHGPEKPESTDPATTYPEFLRRYVAEARAAGATPVLVTPMCRRLFEGGQLVDALLPYAEAMKKVAAETQTPLVDLHTASHDYFERLGEAESATTANAPGDRTHFNEKGARAMAKLVMERLPEAVPAFQPLLRK